MNLAALDAKGPRQVTPDHALADTRQAFDGVAADYDRRNSANRVLSDMRTRIRQTIGTHVPAGSRLLDLGCGPGADTAWLATCGHRVTAIDWSPAMVQEARSRLAAIPELESRVNVQPLGIHELDRLAPAIFDAAVANFGPLNCVTDLPAAACSIARRLRSGGVLVAAVIGRLCPWEIALYLARRDWSRVCVRFTTRMQPVPLDGRTVWTHYYSVSEFERAFRPCGFSRTSLRALGLVAPPPYLEAFTARHPTLVGRLQRIEDYVSEWPGIRSWGDHFLIVLRKAA
ncbi:MAG TPA: class I SAM-dependent methyltransferase [Vicinamibacterales bacterium]|nr:class I SAM-dependent methyltransferase [Vicinamibacterales bacterium]